MKISKQSRRDAKQLFLGCQVNGLIDEGRVRVAVKNLVERKPRGYLGTLSHFHRLVKLDLARRTARVESAAVLDASLRTEIQANLGRAYGGGLQVQFAENPALLGGLRVQVGSDVYDGSVLARLARLEETL